MVAELGHFALILALVIAAVQATVPLIGAQTGSNAWMAVARPAASAQFGFVALAFAALTYSFVISDFSVTTVAQNSHTMKPLIYKMSGVWGNHEGSLLLWILILTLFGGAVAWFGNNLPPGLRARVLGTALDPCGLDLPNHRRRPGQLVGVLRARLGRVLVLGPGGKCVVHAVAGWYRAVAFGHRRGAPGHVEILDHFAGHPDLFAQPAGNLYCPIRNPDIGPRLRHRP